MAEWRKAGAEWEKISNTTSGKGTYRDDPQGTQAARQAKSDAPIILKRDGEQKTLLYITQSPAKSIRRVSMKSPNNHAMQNHQL
jgi:hypothetical protein